MADKFVVVVPTISGSAVATQVRNPSSTSENQTVVNQGPATCYLGQTNAVTTATGVPFPPGSEMRLVKNGGSVWAITPVGPPANLLVTAGIQQT